MRKRREEEEDRCGQGKDGLQKMGLWSRAPHSGVGGTASVFPKSPVKGYFSCDKVRPENCKKGGYLTFHPEISFKKGVVFLSLSFWTPEKFKKGVIK